MTAFTTETTENVFAAYTAAATAEDAAAQVEEYAADGYEINDCGACGEFSYVVAISYCCTCGE